MNLAEKCAFACGIYAAVELSVSGAASAFQRFQLVGLQHNLGVKGPWKTPLRGKVQGRDFSTALGNPATAARFPLFPPPRLRRVNFPNPSRQESEEKKN